jgi:HK97 family phage major capsid protein
MTVQTRWLNTPGGYRPEMAERALDINSIPGMIQNAISGILFLIAAYSPGPYNALRHVGSDGGSQYEGRRYAPSSTLVTWSADTDSSPASSDGTFTKPTWPYRTALRRNEVTRRARRDSESLGDFLADVLSMSAKEFGQGLNIASVTGDSNSNANQINGLLTQINAVSGQVVALTSAAAGDDLTADAMSQVIDQVSGESDDLVIFCSEAGGRKIDALEYAKKQNNDRVQIAGGGRVTSYDGHPIVKCENSVFPDTLTWSGSSITAFTGASTTAIAVVDLASMFFVSHTPYTVARVASTSTNSEAFEMYEDCALAFPQTQGAALLGGISV